MRPAWTLTERLDFGRRFQVMLYDGMTEQEIANAYRMSLIRVRRALRDHQRVMERTKANDKIL